MAQRQRCPVRPRRLAKPQSRTQQTIDPIESIRSVFLVFEHVLSEEQKGKLRAVWKEISEENDSPKVASDTDMQKRIQGLRDLDCGTNPQVFDMLEIIDRRLTELEENVGK